MKVSSRKGNSVSPTAHTYSTAKSPQYKFALKTKTVKFPKRPKPPSPTDHSIVSRRRHNPSIKIKQEFIDRVDTRKGLAPIFGSMNGKSSEVKEKNTSSQVFDVDACNHSQLAPKINAGFNGRGNGKDRPRGKRD